MAFSSSAYGPGALNLVAALALVVSACGDDSPEGAAADASPMQPDAEVVFGCPTHPDATAMPGDPIDGDTYTSFAAPLFQQYCVRCHSSSLTTPQERNFAPPGFNWDVETSVREHLAQIRVAIGVGNFMPPSDPLPSCDERLRMVRWIDADAP